MGLTLTKICQAFNSLSRKLCHLLYFFVVVVQSKQSIINKKTALKINDLSLDVNKWLLLLFRTLPELGKFDGHSTSTVSHRINATKIINVID